MNLGENIYKYRTQKNMSQGDLADALEVSRQSVSKWENNSAVPELEKLMKMAHLFGISLDELVTGEGIEQSLPVPTPQPDKEPGYDPLVAFLSIPLFLIGILIFAFLPGHFISWLVGVPSLLTGLFVVLVGLNAYRKGKQNRPAVTPSPEAPAQEPPSDRFPARKIIGIICLCCGLLCAIVCIILAIFSGNRYEEDLMAVVFIICLPLAVVGVILLLPGRNTVYGACTALYLLLDVIVLSISPMGPLGIRDAILLILPGVLLLVWTCVKLRRRALHPGAGIAVIILLALLFTLVCTSLQSTAGSPTSTLEPAPSVAALADFAQLFPISLL